MMERIIMAIVGSIFIIIGYLIGLNQNRKEKEYYQKQYEYYRNKYLEMALETTTIESSFLEDKNKSGI